MINISFKERRLLELRERRRVLRIKIRKLRCYLKFKLKKLQKLRLRPNAYYQLFNHVFQKECQLRRLLELLDFNLLEIRECSKVKRFFIGGFYG